MDQQNILTGAIITGNIDSELTDQMSPASDQFASSGFNDFFKKNSEAIGTIGTFGIGLLSGIWGKKPDTTTVVNNNAGSKQPPKDYTKLYIGIGVAVALIIVVLIVLKKKK